MRVAAKILLCVVVVLGTARLGRLFTERGLGQWYDGLAKPSWTPPGAAIGAVWAVLFILMAISAGILAARPWDDPAVRRALLAHLGHLALNASWSACFFALRNPSLALGEISLLIVAIGLAILATRAVSPAAAWLLAPYFGWVLFAAFLNLRIVMLNPPGGP